jgi:hypothetical protein
MDYTDVRLIAKEIWNYNCPTYNDRSIWKSGASNDAIVWGGREDYPSISNYSVNRRGVVVVDISSVLPWIV